MTHPDQSEQQLRRALRTMNDLEPPTDELFVQRAVIRGRARTHRRRNTLIAAAAALVVVAGGGGAWLLQGGLPGATTASPASAPEVMSDQGSKSGADSDARGSAGGREQPTLSAGPDNVPVRPPGVASDWFVGPLTPQRAAIEGLAPELTTSWSAVFSGAWAKDDTNEHIVVALTHPDLALRTVDLGQRARRRRRRVRHRDPQLCGQGRARRANPRGLAGTRDGGHRHLDRHSGLSGGSRRGGRLGHRCHSPTPAAVRRRLGHGHAPAEGSGRHVLDAAPALTRPRAGRAGERDRAQRHTASPPTITAWRHHARPRRP